MNRENKKWAPGEEPRTHSDKYVPSQNHLITVCAPYSRLLKGVIGMADRRMFARVIVESAKFIKMPATSQSLYFHLGMNADDDGVVEAYPIMNMVKANEDDLKILVTKGFVKVLNEDLVSFIRDWRVNNKLRSDRKTNSRYQDLLLKMEPEVALLEPTERADLKNKRSQKVEEAVSDHCQTVDGPWTVHGRPLDEQWTAQCSVVEGSIGKDSIVESSVVSENSTHTVPFQLGNESITESEYQELVELFTKPVVDSVIRRILNKPYYGCLNIETLRLWCREKIRPNIGSENCVSGDLCDFLNRLPEERVSENG